MSHQIIVNHPSGLVGRVAENRAGTAHAFLTILVRQTVPYADEIEVTIDQARTIAATLAALEKSEAGK